MNPIPNTTYCPACQRLVTFLLDAAGVVNELHNALVVRVDLDCGHEKNLVIPKESA